MDWSIGRMLTFQGRTKNMTEWAEELGITLSAMSRRISRYEKGVGAMTYEEIFTRRKWGEARERGKRAPEMHKCKRCPKKIPITREYCSVHSRG